MTDFTGTNLDLWFGDPAESAGADEWTVSVDARRRNRLYWVQFWAGPELMREILTILERDARTPPKRIAEMIGRDECEVSAQIQEWETSGVIRRYKTVVDWECLGEEKIAAFIDVSVTPQRGTGFDEIAARIYRYPEVRSVFLVSGGHDLRVIVEGESMKDVSNFVAEKLSTLDHVRSTNTFFLLRKYKDDGDLFVEVEADHRLLVAP